MSYASLMVAVDDGLHAAQRVRLAADLAHRLGTRLVGVAACVPDYPRGYGETAVPMGSAIEDIRQAALTRLAGFEQIFREAACRSDRVEWRSDLDHPVRFLEQQARAADLVVVGRYAQNEGVSLGAAIDLGDVLMELGRPVLVVPPGVERMEAKRIVVGWKSSPQTRRAVWDAMPLLRRAETVQVVRVNDGEDASEIEDVARYLALHDVNAVPRRVVASGWTAAEELQRAAVEADADLIVTGAYGYSRLREWFFGGVTRDLLADASVCSLMSH
ncbi:universal stress protein [Methylobacterium sp.]|jgi:nucleotide-binding universal stress UspA family protein|uniref:universal stress protein n=1 Tax=Methylobacterium sp. TaxID=409 RepID=UPI000C58E13E|nr:universal stress protein [Methylobacterium sp.]MBP31840.1 universal stress protein UspA [Methylobacterium sp.]